MTLCTQTALPFQAHFKREVVADFRGSRISSDGGALLLRAVDRLTNIVGQAACAFTDRRHPESTEHSLEALLRQRTYGLCLGYEDLNDHDYLQGDSLLAMACGREDLYGQHRHRESDIGKPLASSSTLNRLELAVPVEPGRNPEPDRYHKILFDPVAGQDFFTDQFIASSQRIPKEIILDLDATDDPLHGHQEGRFWHGYYGCYCYMPLYIFCGEYLLWAELRPANQDGAAGSLEAVERIVTRLRADRRWRKTRIIIRADSGFCRDHLLAWCEANEVDYIIGLAKNARLKRMTGEAMGVAMAACAASGEPARSYADLTYRTRSSWSRERRVVAKNEALPATDAKAKRKANHRFVVTSLSAATHPAEELYCHWYCQRGEMENRIKEQQLYLFADRTSTAHMWSNQIRLWLSSVAYVLMHALRRQALLETSYARAQCGSIRDRLLKIGAVIRTTTRRIYVHLSGNHPAEPIWRRMLPRLT